MANPLLTAVRGKGIAPMFSRAGAIIHAYGLTAQKMDNSLAELARVLCDFGCNSTLFITAVSLARNQAVIKKLKAQGFELAVHGYTHIDHTQLTFEQLCNHLHKALLIFKQSGIPVKGFRSPYLRSNTDTLLASVECGVKYDASQALEWGLVNEKEKESYRRVLAFYGARNAVDYPALPRFTGSIVQIPYCLPDDEALVDRLKLVNDKFMSEIWLAMLERIYTTGELFTLGLHPERAALCKNALHMVLSQACSLKPPVWIARLDEIDAWYRSLGQTTFQMQHQNGGVINVAVHTPVDAVILARAVDVDAPTKVWTQGYEKVLTSQFAFRSDRLPWIGLSPESPASLELFLKHLGYLVEISTHPESFSYYFHRESFRPEDERPILAELETGNRPLIRLGRWPGGAQAALSVTGDVDAFTLWDYGLRFFNR